MILNFFYFQFLLFDFSKICFAFIRTFAPILTLFYIVYFQWHKNIAKLSSVWKKSHNDHHWPAENYLVSLKCGFSAPLFIGQKIWNSKNIFEIVLPNPGSASTLSPNSHVEGNFSENRQLQAGVRGGGQWTKCCSLAYVNSTNKWRRKS
jgi:hypothetical protein